jgi:hypothetical protein
VLDKLFEEAWGVEAAARKRDFNAYLEVVYISMNMWIRFRNLLYFMKSSCFS